MGDPLATARILLDHGADPNAGYLPDGEPPPLTALSACLRGREDPANQPPHPRSLALARLLLDRGAEVNDERAVDNACGYPHDDAALSMLLRFGYGRDRAPGPWQLVLGSALRTPVQVINEQLRYAAEMNLPGRVRLLLGLAGPSGIDFALKTATLYGNTEIEAMLLAAGGTPGDLEAIDRIIAAGMRGDEATARAVFEASPGLDFSTVWPNPVTRAAILNRPEAVRLFAALGFPLNDRRGSPLHFAALLGHLEVARLLVELGCDPHAEAHDDTPGQFTPPDRTPLGFACYLGHREVAGYLLSL